jgi:K+-sensing histidine kinase KdpD
MLAQTQQSASLELPFGIPGDVRIVLTLLGNDLRRLKRENLRSGSPAAYIVAITCVAVAALAQVAIGRFVEDVSPSIAYYQAIFIAALLGGIPAGTMAAVLSVLLAWWGFDTQYFSGDDFFDRGSMLDRSINNGLNILAAAFIIFAAECFRRVRRSNRPRTETPLAATERADASSGLRKLYRFLRKGLKPNSLPAYKFALACIAIATIIRIGFGWVGGIGLPFASFYPAILIVSLIAGVEAALFAMIVSMLVVGWAFYPPSFSFGPPLRGQVIDIGLYLLASLLTLWLAESYRRVLPHFREIQIGKLNFIASIAACFSMVVLTTIVLMALEPHAGLHHLLICYLVPTTVIAIFYGSMFALFTSFVCAFAAAYFLFPPAFSLYDADPLYVTELVFLVLVGLVTSNVVSLLTHGVRPDSARGKQDDRSLFFAAVLHAAGPACFCSTTLAVRRLN